MTITKKQKIGAGAVVTVLAFGGFFAANAATSPSPTKPIYQCFNKITKKQNPNSIPRLTKPVCPTTDYVLKWSGEDVTPVPVTTKPVTSTTSTTFSLRRCYGVALTNGQTTIDANPAGTQYCLTGTHNWTLTPKTGDIISGDKLTPGILDGGSVTAYGIRVGTATGVIISGLEIRNYTTAGIEAGGSGWTLRDVNVQSPGGITYQSPLVITAGGTYSGNWESTNPAVPAVSVQTTDPVIIQNCNLRGKFHLIQSGIAHTKITVQNCKGYGLNPGVVGQVPGRFLSDEGFDRVTVQNNYFESTSGMLIQSYAGNHTTDTIKVLRNSSKNIDGRKSTGAGFSTSPTGGVGFDNMTFLQVTYSTNVPGIEIAWNQDINEPGNSRVEDNINIYQSSGTSGSPILIHDNYIQGAYSLVPDDAAYVFTGGGIDADGVSQETQWMKVYNNQVVSTTNYGLAPAAGSNNEFYNNRVVSSGLLPNGHQIASANVGVFVWNAYNIGTYQASGNNSMHDNVVGFMGQVLNQGLIRNDTWFPDCPSLCTGNTSLHAGVITLADEAAERTRWNSKLQSNGVTVGTQ